MAGASSHSLPVVHLLIWCQVLLNKSLVSNIPSFALKEPKVWDIRSPELAIAILFSVSKDKAGILLGTPFWHHWYLEEFSHFA